MVETAIFERKFYTADNRMTHIGKGALGGKAAGLASILEIVRSEFGGERFKGITVSVPHMTVITTEIFDGFMAQNHLYNLDLEGMSDERIAHQFQRASLPPYLVGDLRALAEEVHLPLAVRSSGVLEDAMYQPFAGVYATKMIPNNDPSPDVRFQKLVEAVKFVFASTFFRSARYYRESVGKRVWDEKMAVIIQEVVGTRHGARFYPTLSGVARSFNYYPHGHAAPDAGVVDLALGLGKTIVDGRCTWSYSPDCPKAPPPYNNLSEMMKHTQTEFWAVNMGAPPAYDPVRETEYLVQSGLMEAERDGSLKHVASTYVPGDDKVVPGIGSDGPRILDFAPLLVLQQLPLNDLLRTLMRACEQTVSRRVEIEFAVNMDADSRGSAHLGFLQVRPMVVPGGTVEISAERLHAKDVKIASDNVLGNGINDAICDIVYVRSDTFEPKYSPAVAKEIETVNQRLLGENRPYILIGFGRIGTSDPWRGIPAAWHQFSQARVIVEVQRRGMETQFSQGSHFFHNLTSSKVSCFSVPIGDRLGIDWPFIESREEICCLKYVRHVRTDTPFVVMVDGRTRRGAVCHDE